MKKQNKFPPKKKTSLFDLQRLRGRRENDGKRWCQCGVNLGKRNLPQTCAVTSNVVFNRHSFIVNVNLQ